LLEHSATVILCDGIEDIFRKSNIFMKNLLSGKSCGKEK
jgi:hypothetical protein